MSDVVALLGTDHQEFVVVAGRWVQTVSAVEHEYLERRDAMVDGEMLHFLDVPRLDRSDVVAVVDPKSSVGLLEHFGYEIAVGSTAVEIVLPGAHIVEA